MVAFTHLAMPLLCSKTYPEEQKGSCLFQSFGKHGLYIYPAKHVSETGHVERELREFETS